MGSTKSSSNSNNKAGYPQGAKPPVEKREAGPSFKERLG